MKSILSFILFLWFLVPTVQADQIKIVTTTGQITDLVKEIVGDRANVKGLMGPGVDPHLYKATESDVLKLAQADIIFYNGLFLESKLDYILKKMRHKTIVALGERLPHNELLPSEVYSDHFDPHVWFDLPLFMNFVDYISETLIEYDQENKEDYLKNAERIKTNMEKMQQYVLKQTQSLPADQRVLVTAHDAFRYFGRAYDFKVLGLQGMSTETEAGAKDVIQLADFIAENKIKAIFVESSVPTRNIKAVQDAVIDRGWNVKIGGELFSDALGDFGTEEGTYLGMFKHNINTIVNALK